MSFALLASAGLAACDSGANPERLSGPQAEEGWLGWTATPLVTDIEVHGNTVIATVGPEGGRIPNRNHWLSVPAGVLSEPTEFTFKIVGGKTIRVDLSARKLSTSEVVSQFVSPLTLGLSYADGKEKVSDPNRLFIAYILEGALAGGRERLLSVVYPEYMTVTAPIWHFSEYEIGIN